MNTLTLDILDFYRSHSLFSDPGDYAGLLASWPKDLADIKQAIQGLFFHFLDSAHLFRQFSKPRLAELELRYLDNMLYRLMSLDSADLLKPRTLANKLLSSCRDYSLFACAVLRHQSIPARLRVTFNTYCRPHIFHDQVILEYWHTQHNAWLAVDMRMNILQLKHLGMDQKIDCFNVSPKHYISAATAWCLIRSKLSDANQFGDDQGHKGLWYVRDRLLQDLAALNKMEMLIWDCWGLMDCKEAEMSETTLCFLDDIAQMLCNVDSYFPQLTTLYNMHPTLKVPEQITSICPGLGKTIIQLRK